MEIDPRRYGEDWVDDYDVVEGTSPEYTASCVSVLADLAGGGPVLELAAGTGRVALPLAARGLQVVATDASQTMLDVLRRGPHGDRVETRREVLPDIGGDDRFAVISLLNNTIYALASQESQAAVFAAAGRRLLPGGVFVIEAGVPQGGSFDPLRVVHMEDDALYVQAREFDPVTQRMDMQFLVVRDGRAELRPLPLRYVWPGEMDLMARLGGLRLRDRWRGWPGDVSLGTTGKLVSVYDRDED